VLGGGAVGLFDGAQSGGDSGLAGCDGLAVAAAVGALGQVLAGSFDLADVGFALVGVGGDGEHGDGGGGVVKDEADGLGLGVVAGQGKDPGTVGVGPGLLGVDAAVPDPVPGQLAALCTSLYITGHGITARPAGQLPEPWLSMLAHYRHRIPDQALGRDGCAAAAVAFPDLDGTTLALLGLHNVDGSTVLYGHASGKTPPEPSRPPGPDLDFPLRIWVCDSSGRWHATRATARGWSAEDPRDMTLRLEMVPPLSHATAWIEVLAAGQSSQAHATLPLHWQ
jgi:hypothetical protein